MTRAFREAVAVAVAGLLLLMGGLAWFGVLGEGQNHVLSHGIRADAVVLEAANYTRGPGTNSFDPHAKVEFATRAGRVYVATVHYGEETRFTVGQTVAIFYDPANPADAVLASGNSLPPWAWGAFTLLVLGPILGVTAAVRARRYSRGRRLLRTQPTTWHSVALTSVRGAVVRRALVLSSYAGPAPVETQAIVQLLPGVAARTEPLRRPGSVHLFGEAIRKRLVVVVEPHSGALAMGRVRAVAVGQSLAPAFAQPSQAAPPPLPPAEPYALAPPFQAPPARRARGLWVAAVISIVVVVAAGLSLVFVTLFRSTASSPGDQTLVTRAQISSSDLASGWTICGRCGDVPMSKSQLHSGQCIPSSVLGPQTAGDTRNYTYGYDPSTNLEKEHLVVTVRAAQTAADASNILRASTSPAEYPCMLSELTGFVRFSRPSAVFTTESSGQMIRSLPVSGAFIRLSQSFTEVGIPRVAYMDWVTLVVGRFRTTMEFESGFLSPVGSEASWNEITVTIHEDQMIQAAAKALEASQVRTLGPLLRRDASPAPSPSSEDLTNER